MKKVFTLILSLIAFTSFAQIVPGGDMEDWHDYTANGEDLEEPDNWHGSDGAVFWADTGQLGVLISPEKQVFKSGTEHTGSSAARIVTADVLLLGGGLSGALSTGELSFFGVFLATGGTPVNEAIHFVNAWVKYTPVDEDTASMVVTAIVPGANGDSIVGYGIVDITEDATYSQVSCYIAYTGDVTPTKLQITFYSSKSIINGVAGSALWVDDVNITPLAVKSVTEKKEVVKCYPNPSSGIVSVFNTLSEEVTIKAFNINGQEVASKQFKGNSKLDLTAQPSGVYFYNVISKNGQTLQNGKLSIVK